MCRCCAGAAAMSGADLTFTCSGAGGTVAAGGGLPGVCLAPLDEVLTQFNHVIACEVTKRSQSVYETAAPRGHVGVLVGNELHGIPKRVLKTADQVVSIPMAGRG